MKKLVTTTILLCALSLAAIEVHAQAINKWVDEDGVTHYSDQKPANDGAVVREIDIPEAPVSEYDSEQVTERINKQLQQMQQGREAREREAEAAKQARAVDEARQREPIVAEEKKKNRDRDRKYRGPYPKPLPGPFPEKYPRPSSLKPPGSLNPSGK